MTDNFKDIQSLIKGYPRIKSNRYKFVGGPKNGSILEVPNQPKEVRFPSLPGQEDYVYYKTIGLQVDKNGTKEFIYYQYRGN